MINGVDVSDLIRNFTANEQTSLGWNGGQAYVAQTWERMNRIWSGGRGGDCDGGREHGHRGVSHNFHEMNSNNSGVHYEDQKGGQGQGKGRGAGHGRDKGGLKGSGYERGAYHIRIGGLIVACKTQL